MSRQYIYEAKDLVDAGAFHLNVLAKCPCGHSSVLESVDLWAWFSKRGWDDRIGQVARHLRCMKCFQAGRPKRKARIELVQRVATVKLPLADLREFKKVVSRRR